MDASTFRALLPEFDDTKKYKTATINVWINQGSATVNGAALSGRRDLVLAYYVAHHLVLGERNKAAAKRGAPGQATNVISGKNAGGLSLTYDTTIASDEGAGHWNLTDYGKRYWKMVRMAGAGGAQI